MKHILIMTSIILFSFVCFAEDPVPVLSFTDQVYEVYYMESFILGHKVNRVSRKYREADVETQARMICYRTKKISIADIKKILEVRAILSDGKLPWEVQQLLVTCQLEIEAIHDAQHVFAQEDRDIKNDPQLIQDYLIYRRIIPNARALPIETIQRVISYPQDHPSLAWIKIKNAHPERVAIPLTLEVGADGILHTDLPAASGKSHMRMGLHNASEASGVAQDARKAEVVEEAKPKKARREFKGLRGIRTGR